MAGQTLWAPKVSSPRLERVLQIGLCQPLRLWALRGGDTPAVSCLPAPPTPAQYLKLFSGVNGIEVIFFQPPLRARRVSASACRVAYYLVVVRYVLAIDSAKLLRAGSQSAGTFCQRRFDFPAPEQH